MSDGHECPYGIGLSCGGTELEPPLAGRCGPGSCAWPVIVCRGCGAPNRSVARYCSTCRDFLTTAAFDSAVLGAVGTLWDDRIAKKELRVRTVLLPDDVGRVRKAGTAYGILFLGSERGDVLLYNAVSLGREPLARFRVKGPVVSLYPTESENGPSVLITSRKQVAWLRLLPEPHVEPYWEPDGVSDLQAPGVPLGDTILAVRGAPGSSAEAILLDLDNGGKPAARSTGASSRHLGGPVSLTPNRACVFQQDALIVVSSSGIEVTREIESGLDTALGAAGGPGGDHVYVAYRHRDNVGVMEIPVNSDALSPPRRIGNPDFVAPQFAVLPGNQLIVSHKRGASLFKTQGRFLWGAGKTPGIDRLEMHAFPPTVVGPYAVLFAKHQDGDRTIECVNTTPEGLAHNLVRIADDAPTLEHGPIAIPEGVVLLSRGDGSGPTKLTLMSPA